MDFTALKHVENQYLPVVLIPNIGTLKNGILTDASFAKNVSDLAFASKLISSAYFSFSI